MMIRWNKQETSSKMVGLNPATSNITLNISDLATPIKKQIVLLKLKKTNIQLCADYKIATLDTGKDR